MAAIITYVTLDHSALDRGIVQANAKLGTFTKNIERQGMNLEQQMIQQTQRAAMRLAAYGSLFAAGAFLQQIVKVRGEFQQLGIAFETMLDSKEKSDRIMAESITLAQKTPFTLMEVTSNAKQLMAMGVSFEKVMGTIKNLGDVAAGVSVPLSRIAINYGQVLTLGRLQMREIRDFAMAGVPLIGELSKNLGKSTAEITKMVSAGKIGFKDVEEAFRTMSAEGGKFYNLMEKQNKSVTGQISNLVDKWQVMMNEIGKGNEGIIYGGIKGAGALLANYEKIGKTILSLIAIYGTYKAALIAIASWQQAAVVAGNVKAWFQLAASIRSAKDAQIAFNLATKANPWVLLATLIASAAAAMWIFSDSTDSAKENAAELNKQISDEKARILLLVQAIDNENLSRAERNKNLNTLISLSPSILSGINLENIATIQSKNALDAYLESLRNKIRLQQLEKELSDSIAREEEAKKYSQPKSLLKKVGIAVGLWRFEDTQKESKQIIDEEKAIQADILKAIKDTSKIENTSAKETLSTAQQLENTLLEIKTINQIINDIRSNKIKVADPAKEIEDQKKQLKEAEARRDILLGVDKKAVSEQERLEARKQALLEQRNKNELFAATVLQGKLLKVEEETTNQKLAIAANEYQKNLAQVEKNKLDTLQALNKKGEVWSVEDEATYQQGIKASEEVFLAAKTEINRQAAEEIDRIWQEVEDYRLKGYEKELAALNKKFNEEERQLRKLYVDKEAFAKAQLLLDDFYNKKRQDIETNYAIQSIDFQIELGYKKNEATIKGLDKENRLASANYETWRKFTLRKVDLLRLKTDEASKRELALTEADLAVGAEKRKAEQIAQIGQYAGQAADAVLYLSETLSELADKTGNEKLKAFAEEIGAVGKVIQSAAEGAKSSGSWIGAIIGAATSMITQTIDSIATAKAEIYEYQQNQIDFLRAYQGLLLEVKKEDYETVFGISTFAMVAQATKNAKDALQKYNEELAKDSGAPVLKKQQEFINEYKTLLDAYKKGYTDLQGMAVKTKDYTGWATIWGKRDEYKSLIEIAPQLWGADGVFSVENAKKFLETNTQISDAQRKTIQNVIDLKDAYDQNMAIIKEDIKDTFGDIGEAATDSIVDAIVNGTKAFKIFEDAGASAIENLGEKLMYELFFANRFKKLQDDLLATYDLGDPQSIADAQLNLIDQFYGNIGTDMENAQKWGEQWKEKAKEKGFDIWSPEKDKKSSGLVGQIEKTITSDQASELTGLWRRQFDDTRIIRDYTKIGITHLSKIEVNTYNTVVEIQKSNEELKKIVKNTTSNYTGVLQ